MLTLISTTTTATAADRYAVTSANAAPKATKIASRTRYGIYDAATLLLLVSTLIGCAASLAQFQI